MEMAEAYVFRCKALILELLAAVCLVELGHEVVLAAFDNFRIVMNRCLIECITILFFFTGMPRKASF